MSIMGMREWFRKNRVIMLVVFVLLLVGLLISYGRFGSRSGYSEADYAQLVEQAREAYAEDPTSPENVYYMYQTLAQYVDYLNHNDGDREQVNALDQEAVGYYDEWSALLVEEAKAAYQEDPSYANAYMAAQYLYQRATAQAYMTDMVDGGVAMQKEANDWLVLAMGHRVDEINADLAENPNDSALLADLADAKVAQVYYQHEQDSSVDMDAAYEEALALYQQAIDNSPAAADPADLAGYYVGAAGCAYNLNDTDQAAELYQAAMAAAPEDYNANMGYASLLLNIGNIDESLAAMQAYQALIGETSEYYQSVQENIDQVQSLKDMLENPPVEEENDGEDNGEENTENNQ